MLSSLTISQAHDKLKAKTISAVELVQDCLSRIKSVDGKLNAVVYNNGDKALEEAKIIDAKGDFSSPLTGIPYLAKDVFCEKDVPTTACSNMLRSKDFRPAYDSTTTKRLKAVGAISIGKVNTDEFTMGASTETSCYGVTKNPWDVTRVAGGSSGGPAAAVSADECLFALGTDTGGSIRQPASFCGITGIRPTYGRTSRYGAMSMASSLDTIGPMCKNVEDMAITLQAMAGVDPLDATTSNIAVPDYRSLLKKDMKGVRIGIPKEYVIDGMKPEVMAAFEESKKVCASLGATLVDISLPHTKYGVATYYVLCPCEVSSNMARYDGIRYGHTVKEAAEVGNLVEYYQAVRSEGFGPEVKRRIMIGTFALSSGYYDAYYVKAQKVRTLIKQDFDEAFKKVDVILSPVSPHWAFTVGANSNDPLAMYLEDVFTIPQVMAGIPCLSVPCGFSKEGMPIGLQMMGRQWDEAGILSAAFAYEQATQWHMKRPLL